MTPASPNPIHGATQIQEIAKKVSDSRLATAMTVMSIALIGIMLAEHAKRLFKADHFDRDEPGRRWR